MLDILSVSLTIYQHSDNHARPSFHVWRDIRVAQPDHPASMHDLFAVLATGVLPPLHPLRHDLIDPASRRGRPVEHIRGPEPHRGDFHTGRSGFPGLHTDPVHRPVSRLCHPLCPIPNDD